LGIDPPAGYALLGLFGRSIATVRKEWELMSGSDPMANVILDKALFTEKVLELCARFLKNLAFYRTGWEEKGKRFAGEPRSTFNANCFEHCYLDWCKLFGASGQKHHWQRVVSNQEKFKDGLCVALKCDWSAFAAFVKEMRTVRDKVVAHQDVYDEIPTPRLDNALQAVCYLVSYVCENEVEGIIVRNQFDPDERYKACQEKGEEFWLGKAVRSE